MLTFLVKEAMKGNYYISQQLQINLSFEKDLYNSRLSTLTHLKRSVFMVYSSRLAVMRATDIMRLYGCLMFSSLVEVLIFMTIC